MDALSLILIALALSMDAMAVSITSGIVSGRPGPLPILKQAAFFGGFQFLMPVIGYYLVSTVSSYIEKVSPFIAFGLLAFIGIRMIAGACKNGGPCENEKSDPFATKDLLLMAVATSIDALAVGASFALSNVRVWVASPIIGVTTFLLSILGVFIGNRVGRLFQKRAEIFGGAILVGIGLKILLESLLK